MTTIPTRLLVAGCVILCTFVLAAVVLIVTGHTAEATSLMGTGTTLVLAIFGFSKLTAGQNVTQDKVDDVLNGRMQQQVRQVVRDEHRNLIARLDSWQPSNRATTARPVPPTAASQTPQGPVRGSNL